MQADELTEIVRRLRCTIGHLEAVLSMVEAGEPCEPVLHQLAAVQAGLRAAGARLLACQLRKSQDVIRQSACAEERVAEIARLLVLYNLITQFPDDGGRENHD